MLFADTARLGATNSCALTVTASLFTACTWKQRLSIFECPESKPRTCATQLLRFIAAALATTRNLISYMWMWAECGAGNSRFLYPGYGFPRERFLQLIIVSASLLHDQAQLHLFRAHRMYSCFCALKYCTCSLALGTGSCYTDTTDREPGGETQNECANRDNAEAPVEGFLGSGAHLPGMDPHRSGVDGIRVCCGSIRPVPAADPGGRARSVGAVLRSVALGRHRAYRGGGGGEYPFHLASSSLSARVKSGRARSFSPIDPGSINRSVSGFGWTRDGDLSGFRAQLCERTF